MQRLYLLVNEKSACRVEMSTAWDGIHLAFQIKVVFGTKMVEIWTSIHSNFKETEIRKHANVMNLWEMSTFGRFAGNGVWAEMNPVWRSAPMLTPALTADFLAVYSMAENMRSKPCNMLAATITCGVSIELLFIFLLVASISQRKIVLLLQVFHTDVWGLPNVP